MSGGGDIMEIEFTDVEKEMLKWAFNTLTSIVELNIKTDSHFGFDRNDVFRLAEKLGIDY